MFFENDYPDWVDEMYNDFGDDVNQFDLDKEVWEIIKESEEPPHVGNAIVLILFTNIVRYVTNTVPETIIDDVEEMFEFNINAMATTLIFDGESYYDKDDLLKAVKGKIDELEKEE